MHIPTIKLLSISVVSMNNEYTSEPSFDFCWFLSWRLIGLSVLIGALPIATLNVCLWVISQEIQLPFEEVIFGVTNFVVLNCAVSFALKMLLSRGFGGVKSWFVPEHT